MWQILWNYDLFFYFYALKKINKSPHCLDTVKVSKFVMVSFDDERTDLAREWIIRRGCSSTHYRVKSILLTLGKTTSQLIHQLFRCFTYVTAHSPTLLSLLLGHRLISYVTWRAAHGLTPPPRDKNLKHSRPAFLKLWSADHLWSSRSALVVLQNRQKKIAL